MDTFYVAQDYAIDGYSVVVAVTGATAAQYLSLLPSEHADKPLFTTALATLVQGLVDEINTETSVATGFDLDVAMGAQLDVIGQWVGVSRVLPVPVAGITVLPDDSYKVMIRAKIGSNHWDGTMPSLLVILLAVFTGTGTYLFAVDNMDMTMTVAITGNAPSALNLALLQAGYIVPKPGGVKVNFTITSSANAPLFGFDISNIYIAGFDTGAWGV